MTGSKAGMRFMKTNSLILGGSLALLTASMAHAQESGRLSADYLKQASPLIHWPQGLEPRNVDVFVHNEGWIDATPDIVWANLIDAVQWPSWYSNSADIRIEGGQSKLATGVSFNWKTFGFPIRSTVDVFDPGREIGWSVDNPRFRVHHAWALVPERGGTHVITEETQKGDRAAHVQPRSKRSESDHAKPLREYFGALPVSKINAEAIHAYIRDRKAKGLSNTTVNMEVGILRRILKRAKRWHIVEDDVPRLPERRDIGRAMRPEEKLQLLKRAQLKPEWETAYLASVLALNTTMRGCEVKQLRWRDIDFVAKTLTIRRSKTAAGERLIPLNANAFNVILRLKERSQREFGMELNPDWYLFPSAEGYTKPDPTKPMTGWRSAWRTFTRAINCPACGVLQNPGKVCSNPKCGADIEKASSSLAGLRFHDLRHHVITELAESQASDRTIMSIAGHVSPRMLAHYSHVRIEAKGRLWMH